MNLRHIDSAPSDSAFFVDHDPHPQWKKLRERDPLHWTEDSRKGFWSIIRYDDIVAVVSEPAIFSSEYLPAIPSSAEMEQVTPAMLGSGEMLLPTDPPLHGAMRRAFNWLMLPRSVGHFEIPGLQLVREILDQAFDSGRCDFVLDVAAQLPMAFICEIMGIPRNDWADMFKWGNMVAGNDDPEYQVESGSPLHTPQVGSRNISNYCSVAALERRGGSGEDLLSVLGNVTINGRLLTNCELAHNGPLILRAASRPRATPSQPDCSPCLSIRCSWIFSLNIPELCRPRSKKSSDGRVR